MPSTPDNGLCRITITDTETGDISYRVLTANEAPAYTAWLDGKTDRTYTAEFGCRCGAPATTTIRLVNLPFLKCAACAGRFEREREASRRQMRRESAASAARAVAYHVSLNARL